MRFLIMIITIIMIIIIIILNNIIIILLIIQRYLKYVLFVLVWILSKRIPNFLIVFYKKE